MRIKMYFNEIVRRDMVNKLGIFYTSNHIEAITLHIMLKEALTDSKQIIPALLFLEWISGQKAKLIRARHSVSNWKLRENMIVGCKVTCRKENKWDIIDDLATLILPRNKEHIYGRTHFGIVDPLHFPQIEEEYDFFNQIKGLDVLITLRNDKYKELLLSSIQL